MNFGPLTANNRTCIFTYPPKILRFSQLSARFNGLYLWNETRYRQSVSALTTTGVSYIIPKRHELWSTNGFKLELHFYLSYVYSAFHFIARLRRRTSANGTQPNFCQTVHSRHRAKICHRKVKVVPP